MPPLLHALPASTCICNFASLLQHKRSCASTCAPIHGMCIYSTLPNALPGRRRKALPLVCRRMQRLVAAPSLNTQVDLSFGDAATTHSRLQSLCTWLLAGAAEHVQQLCIDLPDDFLDDDDRTDVVCLLSSVLTACGILGSLRELRLLHGAMYFPCAGWVGTLRHLRRLHISSEHYSPLPASLHILCELEQVC